MKQPHEDLNDYILRLEKENKELKEENISLIDKLEKYIHRAIDDMDTIRELNKELNKK